MNMNTINRFFLKALRFSGWLLLPLLLTFLLTGYVMDGRFGFDRLMDEEKALRIHRQLHLPLMVLMVGHVVPAVYFAMRRWGWFKPRV